MEKEGYQGNINSMRELLSDLRSLASPKSGVTFEHFEQLRHEASERTMTPAQLHELINFVSDQVGMWQAKWFFSLSNSPNTAAKTESEQWEQLWRVCSNILSEQVPDLGEQIERRHRLNLLRHHMAQRVAYNNRKPFEKLIAVSVAKMAMALNTLGVHGIANHLYMLALYPKGTIGRISG